MPSLEEEQHTAKNYHKTIVYSKVGNKLPRENKSINNTLFGCHLLSQAVIRIKIFFLVKAAAESLISIWLKTPILILTLVNYQASPQLQVFCED